VRSNVEGHRHTTYAAKRQLDVVCPRGPTSYTRAQPTRRAERDWLDPAQRARCVRLGRGERTTLIHPNVRLGRSVTARLRARVRRRGARDGGERQHSVWNDCLSARSQGKLRARARRYKLTAKGAASDTATHFADQSLRRHPGITFDMSGDLAGAKRLARRPLDGRVRPRHLKRMVISSSPGAAFSGTA
jgi:hypothetical protein